MVCPQSVDSPDSAIVTVGWAEASFVALRTRGSQVSRQLLVMPLCTLRTEDSKGGKG
jgi:hypothetical protein